MSEATQLGPAAAALLGKAPQTPASGSRTFISVLAAERRIELGRLAPFSLRRAEMCPQHLPRSQPGNWQRAKLCALSRSIGGVVVKGRTPPGRADWSRSLGRTILPQAESATIAEALYVLVFYKPSLSRSIALPPSHLVTQAPTTIEPQKSTTDCQLLTVN